MSYPVTPAFAAAARQRTRDELFRVDVLSPTGEEASSDTLRPSLDLPVLEGGCDVARRADYRRQGDMVVVDTTGALTPIASGALLDPTSGNEFRLWRGLVLPDGTSELVPLATLTIENAEITETATARIVSLDGRDRAANMPPWPGPFVLDKDMNGNAAIEAILADRLPRLWPMPTSLYPTDYTLPAAVAYGPDTPPWQGVAKLAEAWGCEAFFDPLGVPTTRPFPDPLAEGAAVWHMVDDGDDVRVFPLTRRIQGDSLRNGVTVVGTASWLIFPVRGEAWLTDRTSPYFYDPADPAASPTGPRPERVENRLVGTPEAAEALAVSLLPSTVGIEEAIEWNSLVLPQLDVADVIEVHSDALGGVQRITPETLRLPLRETERMRGTARRRRL